MIRKQWVVALVVVGFVLAAGSCTEATVEEKADEWISLFNGRDLTGWTPKFAGRELGENYRNTFRVEDGILKVSYDEYEAFDGEFGHLFYQDSFSHYRIRVEYRFLGEQTPGGPVWGVRNSGIMVHGQRPESMTLEQNFLLHPHW